MATTESHLLKRISLLGIPVSVVSLDQINGVLSALLSEGDPRQVIFISFWDLLKARRNRRYGQMVRDAALVVPTSTFISTAARFLDKAEPSAYQPFDFVIRLLGALEAQSGSLYILGLHRKDVQVADANLRQTYPGVRVVGRHHGYFVREREGDIETAIRKASPDLVIAGSGVPKGDRWLYEHRQSLGPGIRLWGPDVLDIVVGHRRRPTQGVQGFMRRTIRALTRKPWTIFRLVLVPWSFVLLLFYRLFRR